MLAFAVVATAAGALDLAGSWRVVYEADYHTGASPGVGLSVPRAASGIATLSFESDGTGTTGYRDGRAARFFYTIGSLPPWARARGIAGDNVFRTIDVLQQGSSEFYWYFLELGDGRLLLLGPGTEDRFEIMSRILVIERVP